MLVVVLYFPCTLCKRREEFPVPCYVFKIRMVEVRCYWTYIENISNFYPRKSHHNNSVWHNCSKYYFSFCWFLIHLRGIRLITGLSSRMERGWFEWIIRLYHPFHDLRGCQITIAKQVFRKHVGTRNVGLYGYGRILQYDLTYYESIT